MQAVERGVDEARQSALDRHAPADEVPHQAADSREAAQGDQRALVAVDEPDERAALLHPDDVLENRSRHLVRGLRARRDGAFLAWRGVARAVAQREDAGVFLGLERVGHDDLVVPVGLEPQTGQEIGALYSGGPDDQVGLDHLAGFRDELARSGFDHLHPGAHRHAKLFQLVSGCRRKLVRQGGENAPAGLQQGHAHPALVEDFKTVVPERACRIVELCRQLHARRPAADDRHAHLLVGTRIVHHGPADPQTVVQQPRAEAVGLFAAVEVEAMLLHAGHAEIVRDRSQRQRKDVVADRVARDQLAAVLVLDGGEADRLGPAVDTFQAALKEAVAPARAVSAIADLVEIGVKRSGGDLVQERLPDVAEVLVDQDDVVALAPVFRAEPADQFKPARASADDDNLGLAAHRTLLRTSCAAQSRAHGSREANQKRAKSCPWHRDGANGLGRYGDP